METRTLLSAINDYDLFLFDLWGVIVEGEKIYPGIIDVINEIMQTKQAFFVTNAPRPAMHVRDNLKRWGVTHVEEDMVFTSGDMAVEIIKNAFGTKKPTIYHLGADRTKDIFMHLDHIPTSDLERAEVIMISLYRDENENIREFDDLLEKIAQRNVLTICSNPDTTIPLQGKIRYHAGYFSSIVEKHGGKIVYSGKPKPMIYEAVLKKAHLIPKERILMVGDTLETDVKGAIGAGIDSALVLTGNAEKFHKNHADIKSKVKAIYAHADSVNIVPTFVVKS